MIKIHKHKKSLNFLFFYTVCTNKENLDGKIILFDDGDNNECIYQFLLSNFKQTAVNRDYLTGYPAGLFRR